ncbi:MAG: TatD family hydrolase [Staphylococcus sp.]|nr:TatD family hydrolase [Staphylococcus sp.]
MTAELPTCMFDVHTHALRRNAIVNLDPVDILARRIDRHPATILRRGYLYSVGIHPWNFRNVTIQSIRLLHSLAAEPSVVAIGECGLDAVGRGDREAVLCEQTELLRIHFMLSETLGKPMILHIVKAFPEIIALRKLWRPSQPWIIHGFRGKPQLAAELVAHGFHLSFGRRYNPASFAFTPPSRRLRETDMESY